MICLICNSKIENDLAVCPICNNPIMYKGDDLSPEEEAEFDKMLNERRMMWNSGIIGVYVYTNECVDGHIEVVSEDVLNLGNIRDLATNEITWHNENFARMYGASNIKVSVKKADGSAKNYFVNIADPEVDEDSFWNIGVIKTADTSFKIVLGNKDKYETSKEIIIDNKEN